MNTTERLQERVRLRVEITEAAKLIPVLWPLSHFIAVNPLWDLVDLRFEDAVTKVSQWMPVHGYPRISDVFVDQEVSAAGPVSSGTLRTTDTYRKNKGDRKQLRRGLRVFADQSNRVNRELSNWCGLYVSGVMEDPDNRGMYAAWQRYVLSDPFMRRWLGRQGRARLGEGPTLALDALGDALRMLRIPTDVRVDAFRFGLTSLPGWSGYAKWRSLWATPDDSSPKLDLEDLLAIRYFLQAVLISGPSVARSQRGDALSMSPGRFTASQPEDSALLDLTMFAPRDSVTDAQCTRLLRRNELRYQSELINMLSRSPQERTPRAPIAQVVMCIDVRSEGFRRHLESVGPFETFGFAGFFALPIRFRRWGSEQSVALCPVIVNPTAEIREEPSDVNLHHADRMIVGQQALGATHSAFDGTKNHLLSSLLLAEAGGLFAAPVMVLRTAFPHAYASVRRKIKELIEQPISIPISLEESAGGMSQEEKVLFAESALRSMGLTKDFAPLVILCGHGSTTENNPYASSLDCGACAGNRGGASARAASAIFNEPAVRRELRARSIFIPDETVFMAGEHDTALDTVTLYDDQVIDASFQPMLATVKRGLKEAGRSLGRERARSFPGYQRGDQQREVAARSSDWAQVQPEWGLAGNACFIVAPRLMTKGINLQNRSFLHSYDPSDDADGGVLEAILTGPMIVAHWINMQYYFSSVDPQIYSSGDKTLHNVVGGVGVVSGVGGDLRSGLPLQSVVGDHGLYHEPLRLLVVISSQRECIDAVVGRNPVLRDLLTGEWVFVIARESDNGPWWTRECTGTWKMWTPEQEYKEWSL